MGQAKLRGNREYRILTSSNKWREMKAAIQKNRELKKQKHLNSIQKVSQFFQVVKTKNRISNEYGQEHIKA